MDNNMNNNNETGIKNEKLNPNFSNFYEDVLGMNQGYKLEEGLTKQQFFSKCATRNFEYMLYSFC